MFAAIEPNMTRCGAEKITADICRELEKLHIKYAFSDRHEAAAALFHAAVLPDDVLYRYCSFVIAVGGDGSIIRAAKYAAEYDIPVLGINAGHVAFMAGLESDELSLLNALITGEFSVDNRMMLHINIVCDGKTQRSYRCLNDAVFARGAQIYLTEINVECDGAPVNKYRSDGIILATPTGSTAYSFAAGGPVVEPTLESIILTPISPYSKSSRCIMFSADSKLKVSPCDPSRPLFLSADGEKAEQIPDGCHVTVRKCRHYASFIRIKNEKFWHILDNKIEK